MGMLVRVIAYALVVIVAVGSAVLELYWLAAPPFHKTDDSVDAVIEPQRALNASGKTAGRPDQEVPPGAAPGNPPPATPAAATATTGSPPPAQTASTAPSPAPPSPAPATTPAAAEQQQPAKPVTATADAPATAETATADPAPAPRCNVQACAAAYQSFRASDCTYQPYEGPRRMCEKSSVARHAARDHHRERGTARRASRRTAARPQVRPEERQVELWPDGSTAYADERIGNPIREVPRRVIVIRRSDDF